MIRKVPCCFSSFRKLSSLGFAVRKDPCHFRCQVSENFLFRLSFREVYENQIVAFLTVEVIEHVVEELLGPVRLRVRRHDVRTKAVALQTHDLGEKGKQK